MTSTVSLPVDQAIVDKGVELYTARKIRRKLRRGLYVAFGSEGQRYRVDIRGLIEGVRANTAPTSTPTCTCPYSRFNSPSICKHIAGATFAAMNKGWL